MNFILNFKKNSSKHVIKTYKISGESPIAKPYALQQDPEPSIMWKKNEIELLRVRSKVIFWCKKSQAIIFWIIFLYLNIIYNKIILVDVISFYIIYFSLLISTNYISTSKVQNLSLYWIKLLLRHYRFFFIFH